MSDSRGRGDIGRTTAPPGESTFTQPMPNAVAMSPPDKQPGSTLVQLQRNWSEIQPGTSKDRVDALLGKPERVMRINDDLVWYYVYPGVGRGSVFFDGKGKVSNAQSPGLGWSR